MKLTLLALLFFLLLCPSLSVDSDDGPVGDTRGGHLHWAKQAADYAKGTVSTVKETFDDAVEFTKEKVVPKVKQAADYTKDTVIPKVKEKFNDAMQFTKEEIIPKVKQAADYTKDTVFPKVKEKFGEGVEFTREKIIPKVKDAADYTKDTVFPKVKEKFDEGLEFTKEKVTSAKKFTNEKVLPKALGILRHTKRNAKIAFSSIKGLLSRADNVTVKDFEEDPILQQFTLDFLLGMSVGLGQIGIDVAISTITNGCLSSVFQLVADFGKDLEELDDTQVFSLYVGRLVMGSMTTANRCGLVDVLPAGNLLRIASRVLDLIANGWSISIRVKRVWKGFENKEGYASGKHLVLLVNDVFGFANRFKDLTRAPTSEDRKEPSGERSYEASKRSHEDRSDAYNPSSKKYNPTTEQKQGGKTSIRSHNRDAKDNKVIRANNN